MAFDVHVRFTMNAESDESARRLLEVLLARFLDPTSTAYQDSPHAILDSWEVRESVPPIEIGCETEDCPNYGTVINTISGLDSQEARAEMLEQWASAHESADVCKACGRLGVPREDE